MPSPVAERSRKLKDSEAGMEDLAQRLRYALTSSSYPAVRQVSCDWEHDVLILRGQVPTFYLKQVVQSLTQATVGCRPIADQIEVRSLKTDLCRPR